MSSYSLNPNNVPPTNYNTQAPVKRVSTNTTPTPPAVAKAPPAPSEPQSLVTPKNIAIGLGSIAGLLLLGLGIKSHTDDVARKLESLSSETASLKNEVAEKVEEISELKKSGGAKKPAGDALDDLDDSVEDTKPEKGKGWFQWFSGKAEEKKAPVAPPPQDIVISFDTPSKPDPSKRSWTNWFPKPKQVANIDPNDIPAELGRQRFVYTAGDVYKKNGRLINAPADGIAQKIQNVLTGRTVDKTLRIKPQYNLNVQQVGEFIHVMNKSEKVASIVPLVDYKKVPFLKMKEWVEDGLFVLPPTKTIGDYNPTDTFSIPQGGFPHQVFYKEQGDDLLHPLPGFLVPN
jgi:hypothetical protein